MTTINNNNHPEIYNYYMSMTQDNNKETFRIICDYPKYFISNFGRIISFQKNSWEFISGTVTKQGYVRVGLIKNKKKKMFKVSRLVALSFIPNPKNLPIVDHIDQNKSNDHITNLRWCTHLQNQHNVGIMRSNSSGYKGIDFHKDANKFRARILINGKSKYLGHFNTAEEASDAYEAVAKIVHGEFYHKT